MLFKFKYLFYGVAISMVLLLQNLAYAKDEPLNQVVAIVNDDIITSQELAEIKDEIKTMPENQQINDKQLHDLAIKRAIDDLLQVQVAKRVKITIEDEELQKTIEGIAGRNHMTVEDFKLQVEKEGKSFDDFRDKIRKQLLIRHVRQQYVSPRISITDEEAQKLIKSDKNPLRENAEYHVIDYKFPFEENAKFDQIRVAKKSANLFVEKFKKMPGLEYSALGYEKNDLGWRKLNALPELFANQVRKMRKGGVSAPLQAENGLHVLYLLEDKMNKNSKKEKEIRLRQILMVPTAKEKDADVKAKITKIRQAILSGERFEGFVKQFTTDELTKNTGGDMGWKRFKDLPKEFVKKIEGLAPGQVSQVFNTDRGWHLVQVVNQREIDVTPQYDLSRAKQYLFEQRFDDAFETWIKTVRDAGYIKIIKTAQAGI